MPIELHDLADGNDDNDDPLHTKNHKFKLPSMSYYVSGSFYILQFNIAFVIFFILIFI
jgi:hypothetical protein